jgi:hypothetical protein
MKDKFWPKTKMERTNESEGEAKIVENKGNKNGIEGLKGKNQIE